MGARAGAPTRASCARAAPRRRPCAPTAATCASSAAWATARGREPGELAYRDLRGYAAALSERRLAKASVARKLAAVRGLHGHLVATGDGGRSNPADLLPRPKRGSRLPRVLGRDEVAALLDRIPARGPLEVRDRALFELAYSCGLRADEIVSLDLGDPDFDGETLRATGKGSKTRVVPIGEPAQRALSRYLETARHALGPARDEPALFVSRRGRRLSPSDVRRRLAKWVREAARRGPRLAAHAPPLVRHPSARGRRRPALDPGAARPLERLDHSGLHAGRALPAAPGVRKVLTRAPERCGG